MKQATPAEKSRYKGGRKPATVVLNEELFTLAKAYFPTTSHRSLSRFLESALRAEFRKRAGRIRGAGLRIPDACFSK